ncbi:MAG: DUF4832 domain-containing protein [Bacteroidales bacterium]
MRNTFRIIVLSFFFLLLAGSFNLSAQVGHLVKYYSAIDSVLVNPERGFFHFTSVRSSKSYNALEADKLQAFRNEGITLIFRNYILDGHVSDYLSSAFLSGMEKDFGLLRQYGLKAVIRFCYTEKSTPPYGDATLDWMLIHIQQLEPILRKNSDVILVLQAGFIGAWGEWYYTDHFASSPGVILPQHWEMRKQLVSALLNALPEYRQVELRTPVYKWKIVDNDTTPVSLEIAFTGVPKARLGHHNDCFLASPDDVGTYQNIPVEKKYLERDSRFTMVTGETCGVCSPCSDCDNTLQEMARFHWTAINLDYHPSVISGWKTQGCFETINNKLGYRYRMIASRIQQQAKPGGAFHLELKLINEGFSNPVNPRNAYFVLKNSGTGQTFRVKIPGDLRLWPLHDTIRLDITAGLPSQMSVGNYEVFFEMPDFDLSLSQNPLFSIRTANKDTWRAASGLNSLLTEVEIVNDSSLPGYAGNLFFVGSALRVPTDLRFKADGLPLEWDSISTLGSIASPHTQAKAFFDNDTLFLFVGGAEPLSSVQIFIDVDRNPATGYPAWPWTNNGADLFFENGLLYSHQGIPGTWNWALLGPVSWLISDTLCEVAIPASLAGITPGQQVGLAFMLNNAFPLPSSGQPFLSTTFNLNAVPDLRYVLGPGQITLYWQAAGDDNISTIVQRSEGNGGFTTRAVLGGNVPAFTDKGLDSTKAYRYAVYRASSDNFSQRKTTPSLLPNQSADEFISMRCDGFQADWNIIEPQATLHDIRTMAVTVVNYLDSLYLSIRGYEQPTHVKFYFDTDLDASTGLPNLLTLQPGCDRMISGDSLFIAQGNSWTFLKKIKRSSSIGFTEWAVNLTDMNLVDVPSARFSGVINHNKPFPDKAVYAWFYKFVQPGIPQHFAVKNSQANPNSKIILEWNTRNDAEGYIIERSVDDLEHFNRIARLAPTISYYHDVNVDTSHQYYYRIFAFNGQQRSDYSAILGGRPGQIAEGMVEHSLPKVFFNIAPNPAEREFRVALECQQKAVNARLKLMNPNGYVVRELLLGEVGGELELKISVDGLPKGVYFLRFEATNYSPATLKVVLK